MRKRSIFWVSLSPKQFIMLDVPRTQLSSTILLPAGAGFYGASHSSALFGTLGLPWDGQKDLPQGLQANAKPSQHQRMKRAYQSWYSTTISQDWGYGFMVEGLPSLHKDPGFDTYQQKLHHI